MQSRYMREYDRVRVFNVWDMRMFHAKSEGNQGQRSKASKTRHRSSKKEASETQMKSGESKELIDM